MFSRKHAALLAAIWLLGSCPMMAQSTGTLTGIVIDPQGDVVPGASIVAENLKTNLRMEAKTNDFGLYLIPSLPVGEYRLTATALNFKTKVKQGIQLQIDQKLTVDFDLSIATLEHQVDVENTPALLETTTSTLNQVVDTRRINDLPLNGRNVLGLLGLQAGVSTRGGGSLSYANPYVYPTQGGYLVDNSINGARGNQTNYKLDGGNNTHGNHGVANPYPNPDAVQEFSVQTNSFSAENGGVVGGVVNVVTKSGTNEFHGSLWEFHRNKVLNARNFFAPKADDLKRNQFGVAVGGPVWLPSLYKGTNRTFFFGSYQGTRNRRAQSGLLRTVFTQAQEGGDLTGTATARDPLTGNPFPNNVIPRDRFDPAIVKLLDLMPAANQPGNILSFAQPPQKLDDDQYVFRIDHVLPGGHQLTGRYTRTSFKNPSNFFENNIYSVTSGFESIGVQNVMVSYTHMLSPNLVNVARVNYMRTPFDVVTGLDLAVADLGARVPKTDPGNLNVSIAGFSGPNTGFWNTHYDKNLEFTNDVSYSVGRHSTKFGFSLLKDEIRSAGNFISSGNYSFTGEITGNVIADFLLGKPATFAMRQVADKKISTYRPALYVQDDIRLTNHFTVNLGLRWDPNRPYVDSIDMWPAFRPGLKSQRFANAPVGLVFANDAGVPRGVSESDWNNLGPRLGFAWNPKGGRNVIRGGYGIFFDHLWGQSGWRFSEPYTAQTTIFAPPSFSNPYGSSTPQDTAPVLNPDPNFVFSPNLAVGSLSPNFQSAFVQSGNLTLERRLTNDLLIRTAYVGTVATQLMTGEAVNPATYVPNNSTIANTNDRRVSRGFGNLTEIRNGARSWYHSLQLTLQKRVGDFSFTSNYTLSKSIDSSSKAQDGGVTEGPNPFNRRTNRALSDFDSTHNFNTSLLWNLPFFKTSSGALHALLGGWQVNGIVNLQSGIPFGVTDSRDIGFAGIGAGVYGDLIGDPFLPTNRPRNELTTKYFQTNAFAAPTSGTFGTAGRNIIRGPGFANVDTSIIKDFRIHEKTAIQFRSEFFNLFNRPNFGQPTNVLTSPSFGRILTASDPRIIQFALKVIF